MFARRVLPLVAWLLPACVDGQEARVNEYCRALCEFEATCGKELDLKRTPAMERQCQRDCLDDPYTHATREEVMPFVEECFAERSCDKDVETVEEQTRWLTQQANVACLGEGSAEVDPSEACQEFCEDRAALMGCTSMSAADCRKLYCGFEDHVVDERRECFEIEDCTERRICLEIVRD